MSDTARISLFSVAPACAKALIAFSGAVRQGTLGARLIELVQLRVSQINGCGVCVDMHWRELIRQEVAPRHLNALPGWREAPFFSDRERAALGWAEALNALPQADHTEPAYAAVQQHFNDTEVAELSYTVAAIRSWNLLNLGLRSQIPDVPAPGF